MTLDAGASGGRTGDFAEHNASRNAPALPARLGGQQAKAGTPHQIGPTVNSARGQGQAQQPSKGMFRLFTVEELDTLPEAAWLVEDILPGNGLAMVYGEPGAYKTFLGLDWALSIGAGLPWHGHQVRQGDVVYIYAEGAKGLPKRIRAWRAHRGGEVSHFRVLPTSLDIRDETDVGHLAELIQQANMSPRLVVIDTLARCFGAGDENAQKDMNAFVRGCDIICRTFPNATVLVIHHAGKNAKAKDRGSTALRGAADTVMFLKRAATTVTLTCEKQKDADPFQQISLTSIRVDLGNGDNSCMLQPATAGLLLETGSSLRATTNDQKALEALKSLGSGGATFSDWQKAAQLKPSTFKDVRKRLSDEAKLRKEGSRYFVVH